MGDPGQPDTYGAFPRLTSRLLLDELRVEGSELLAHGPAQERPLLRGRGPRGGERVPSAPRAGPRRSASASAVGVGEAGTGEGACKGKPVRLSTSASVTPGCTVASSRRPLARSNANTQRSVTTAWSPPIR